MSIKEEDQKNCDNKIESKLEQEETDFTESKASFEDAITATGFGKFNLLLLCFLIPASFTQASEHMGMSYILPMVGCDLDLTLQQKGLLNAMPYAGMITSGLMAGILCDMFGRKKIIVYGYILHILGSIAASFSSSYTMLIITKYFCGFVFNGPFSACSTYLTEFHASHYRARVQAFRGTTFSLGFLLLPLIASVILPLKINISLFGSYFHSWNLYILFCATGPLLAALGFSYLPESPKFLMSNGRNKEALHVFQQVYSWNTGKSKSHYPVKQLQEEITPNKEATSAKHTITQFLFNMKPLFRPPYVNRLVLGCSTSFIFLLSLQIIKLWLPQILQLANDYNQYSNETDFNVCYLIDYLAEEKPQSMTSCQVNTNNSSVYIYSIIIAGLEIILFAISGFVINRIGKNRLVVSLCTVAPFCAAGMYFAPNTPMLIILFAIYIPFLDLAGLTMMTISLEMFSTHFRAFALSCNFVLARVGSLAANVVFSTLVSFGCEYLFIFCTVLTAVLPVLIYLFPNTDNKALE